MVISSSHIYSKGNLEVVKKNTANKINVKNFSQNGQIQIYQSSYRGSYPSIIRDSLRNAALGRKVLLVQFMKGGVKQGVDNAVNLCGNLTWVRSSHSFDQYNSEEIGNNNDVLKINSANKTNLKKFIQNGQIQIYQSLYRGSYSSIIRDCLRNAALGRKVLLIQFMKGGVKQGVDNPVKLCGNLTWIRSSHSFDESLKSYP